MNSKTASIITSISELVMGDSDSLKDYSEKSSFFIYEWLTNYLRFDIGGDKEMESHIKEGITHIRDGSAYDKMSSDFLWEIQQGVNNTLEKAGYETSNFGYWHKKPNPLIAFWEARIRDLFEGIVLSVSQDSFSYITGESWLDSWETWDSSIDCFPSSPIEAFELASECEGFFETEWGYVIDNLREELDNQDLSQYEDVDEALCQADFGLNLEDFPKDYREQVTDLFEDMKKEHSFEPEYEEDYE